MEANGWHIMDVLWQEARDRMSKTIQDDGYKGTQGDSSGRMPKLQDEVIYRES